MIAVLLFLAGGVSTSTTLSPRLARVAGGDCKLIRRGAGSPVYVNCNAVILDLGDVAVYAHANAGYLYPVYPPDSLDGTNVVDRVVAEARRHGLDPRSGRAIVVTGWVVEAENIVEDFDCWKVPVERAEVYRDEIDGVAQPIARRVYYNPVSDGLVVRSLSRQRLSVEPLRIR